MHFALKPSGEETSLCDYILGQQDTILERWHKLSKRDAACSLSSRLSFEEFLNDVPHLLSTLSAYLKKSADSDAIAESMEVIRQHGRQRWKQGFDLEELLRDLGKLQQTILEEVCHYFDIAGKDTSAARVDAITRTAFFFSEAQCASVEHFRNLRREEASATAKELEQMRDYVGQIDRARRHFISDVSHELGSSLTAISGISEILKHDESLGNDAILNEFGQIIDESVSSASKVLESLLQITRIEAGQSPAELKTVRLGEFFSKWMEKVSAEKKINVKFAMERGTDFEARVDIGKLKRTVETLFDFMKVDSSDGSIGMRCRQNDDSWTLRLNWADHSKPEDLATPTLLHRKEIDLLLVNRLCSIQKAAFQFREGRDGCHEMVLNFPLGLSGDS